MSTKFLMTRDVAGYNGFGVMPTYDIQGCSFAANVAQSFTVPDDYSNWIAIFSYTPGAQFFVNFTSTATVPGGTAGAIGSCLNPSARAVSAGDIISIITPDATSPYVTIEFQVVAPYQN